MRKWYAQRVVTMRFSCAHIIDALAREDTACACGESVKFNTRKMRHTTNSQNIVTLNNSDLKVVCSTDRHCLYKHLHSGPLLSPTGHSVPPYTQQLLKLEACVPTTPVCLPAALLEITTPLISKVWEHELATHPDQSFASYVVNGIKRGFRVSYDHTRTQASSESNMASAIERPDVVSDTYSRRCRWTAWWSFLSHKFHIFIAT